ncbi:CDP-glycerol:glycerophosphate glycerophosphotransferase [Peribacillus butanolivorans]|uniref:CDP-glycerol glycerophosphotransferase family protein n=1 Tax=Peribacillus butanolivorans TaxID=421767 RepID=UPI0006A6D58A|nr:CDP-glycerol glycerophosphotransferase family protein [Peribacillus butanolivorans]KON70878.1 CDP-glycerol:glycerophosphate glycerophosphotransferase [Peribacillus butanolivorans]
MNKKVLKRKIDFLKEPIANYLSKENHQRVNNYAKFYDKLIVKKNTIFYESRDGNSITDSPYAMFKYMIGNQDFKDFVHIWSIQDFSPLSGVISKYKDMPNVKFVQRNSKDYFKYLATSEYLINNSTFQSFFIPKNDQVYINTWHGTPLKNMGFDIPGNPSLSQNVLRNFLSTEYILSPNAHTTKIFTESYKLNGLYKGKIIEEGYPRIDLTLNTNPEEFNDYLRTLGLGINGSKENILYAPTWKGTNLSKVNNDVLQIIADINYLESQIGDQYNILIKVHPYLYKEANKHTEIKERLIPDYVDTNELLATVDLLITDYSSIFFDFLVTNKPILFYTWDADVYTEQRGQYLKNDELPGPMLFNSKELVNAIKDIKNVKMSYCEKYKMMQEKFTNYEDGKVTERIVLNIFNRSSKELNTITGLDSSKEKILIYPGGMRNNGITSSFLNLMNNIDYEKYDVSCFTATPHSKEVLKNLDRVNKNVRFLFKPGLPAYKFFEVYRNKFINNRGERGFLGKKLYPENAYVREHARLFGKTKFDFVIDFSGYSLYWAKFLLSADAKKKICYLHNDLLSESEKIINGKRPHRINLRGLFSVYNRFDKLVSVSKGTMELNRKNLLEYADYDKFDYVMNSINPEKILQIESKELEVIENDEKSLITENFKARAILKGINKYYAWNILPGNLGATKFRLGKRFENAEIVISRKARDEYNTFYKFSFNNQIIGWITDEAIELMPDSIIYEKDLDKIAKLVRPGGNHIWSKPYKVEGTYKVSTSLDFKGIIVKVDKEVKTQHSIYSRISINNTLIGWIDNSALSILEHCSIYENLSNINKKKIHLKRKYIISRNYKKNKNIIDNIENRTLKEINISTQMYGVITKPENHKIWTKAYPNFNAKKIAKAKEYEGQIANIITVNKTIKGIYYLFEIDNEKIGWLDTRAFKIIDTPIKLKEREVQSTSEINFGKKDYIWNKPFGLQGAKTTVGNLKSLNGSIVSVDREAVTLKGTYSHIIKDGVSLGWLDNNALKIKEVFGLEVDNQFIPYPRKDNFNFVNMGRLSPEKGQDNLIYAFARFQKEHKNSKLYILGQGPLKEDLQDLINELDLNNSVHLLGQLENPFSFMKKCDCFVLSSHYEGQPMVLLEAMTLGMKIMATDIIANRTVLEDGKYGLLVEDSINGLEKGLYSMIRKENLKIEKFDYNQYNSLAMETFNKCL